MSRAKLTAKESQAILEQILNRQNCSNGCDCIFCRVWDEGYEAGKQEVAREIQRSLQQFLEARANA